jgi:hypothetical protein
VDPYGGHQGDRTKATKRGSLRSGSRKGRANQ